MRCGMKRKICFLVNFFLLFALTLHAQNKPVAVLPKLPTSTAIQDFTRLRLPGNFYLAHTGFFCRQEYLLEKKFSFPIKIRLGSVPYCDALEGKNRTGF